MAHDGDTTKLIINYLPQSMTDNEMQVMFRTCGPLESCKIMRDKNTGYSFGYGFVQYQEPGDAVKAISQLNGLPVSHKRIKVSYSRPRTTEIKDTNLLINNVPSGISEEELMNLFTPYGEVITKNILKNSNGGNKGIAFVRYSKKFEADEAIKQLNGYCFNDQGTPLHVKVAEDHTEKKAAFYTGQQEGGYESNDYGANSWAGPERGRGGGRGGGVPRGGGGRDGGNFRGGNAGGDGYGGYGGGATGGMMRGGSSGRGTAGGMMRGGRGNDYGGNDYGSSNYGGNNYGGNKYGGNDYGGNDYGGNDYGGNDNGGNDYGGNDYGGNNYGSNTYGGNDYGGNDYGGNNYGGNDYGRDTWAVPKRGRGGDRNGGQFDGGNRANNMGGGGRGGFSGPSGGKMLGSPAGRGRGGGWGRGRPY